ncbi:MAG: macro domain-containing protein [Chloroflexota bacterium]|nr:macro domain-containing protein [Chloroflexota bacterium]
MALPIEIEVWQGEISELEVDAIVIPANESLFMTTNVAASVKRHAGDDVERAAVAQGPVEAGRVVVTSGGRLAAPYIVHAVAVGHELQPDTQRLRAAVQAALSAVEHLGLRRIAMAPLGTERGVFTSADATRILLEGIAAHAERESGYPESVVIAVPRTDELVATHAVIDAVVGVQPPLADG